MTEKEFIKLANKHLFALEKPINAFGGTKLEVFGVEKLYKQLLLHNVIGMFSEKQDL